jgi:hypothetical protein
MMGEEGNLVVLVPMGVGILPIPRVMVVATVAEVMVVEVVVEISNQDPTQMYL